MAAKTQDLPLNCRVRIIIATTKMAIIPIHSIAINVVAMVTMDARLVAMLACCSREKNIVSSIKYFVTRACGDARILVMDIVYPASLNNLFCACWWPGSGRCNDICMPSHVGVHACLKNGFLKIVKRMSHKSRTCFLSVTGNDLSQWDKTCNLFLH